MPQFEPGRSGNPKGRPKKGQTMTDILKAKGDIEVEVKNTATGEARLLPRKEALAESMWMTALRDPNSAAARYIYDRIDGKPTETHNIGGRNGGPLRVVYEKEFKGV